MILCVKSMVGISLLDIKTVLKISRQKENKDVFQRKENPHLCVNFFDKLYFITTFVV